MTFSRSMQTADRATRAAAIERLSTEHGIRLGINQRGTKAIADAVMQVEPSLSGEPILVLRAWLAMKPENVAGPREMAQPKQSYSPCKDRGMAASMARLVGIPKPMAMASNIPYLGWLD